MLDFSQYPLFAKKLLEETNYDTNEGNMNEVGEKYSE